MFVDRAIASILLMVIGLVGCDSFKGLAGHLDGKGRDTQAFWAKLQRIQWHGNQVISSLHDANSATVKTFDVDGVASGFTRLSEKHSEMASQLTALDTENVDELASNYRNGLVEAHLALVEENQTVAAAMQARDMGLLKQRKSKLETLMTRYVELCNSKTDVMSQLKSRYHLEFDVAE